MNWYLEVLKKYADYGRSRRKEYWYFILFNGIIIQILEMMGKSIHWPYLSFVYELVVF